MPTLAPPQKILAVEDNAIVRERDADDFGLRVLIESMIREGADEPAIVQALHAVTGSQESRPEGGLRRDLRRLARFMTRRR